MLFFFIWKPLHERFFRSSPTLSQFPGRSRVIGCNVRQISVSLPLLLLLPRVNALSSESTASLCVYGLRRWVLLFFSSPSPRFLISLFNFFSGYRNFVSPPHPVAVWSRWVDLVLGRMRVSKGKKASTVCALFRFLERQNAWEREEPVALCECERKNQSTCVFSVTITRTFLASQHPWVFCFLISFSIQPWFLKNVYIYIYISHWIVKCYEYLYFFSSSFLAVRFNVNACLIFCLLPPSLCENVTLFVKSVCRWGGTERVLKFGRCSWWMFE